MPIRDALLPEFEQECGRTRRLLEVVPEDKFEWKPHEKSMPLGRLATHLAELPGWSEALLAQDEFDVAPPSGEGFQPTIAASRSELLETFDANVEKARQLISGMSDEDFMKSWTLKKGGEDIFSAPRIGVTRDFLLSHTAHHRGQLTVYLRLNGVPVPPSYGPTADYPDL